MGTRAGKRMAGVLVTAAIVAGCSSPGKPGTADHRASTVALTSSQPPGTKPIDEIAWALPYGEPTTLDPIKSGDYAPGFLLSQMCDPLLRFSPEWRLEPGLATSWDRPDDRTLVLTIRRGVTFWDGKPLTPRDVVFSLKRNLDVKAGSTAAPYFVNVQSMEATGPDQVTVRFKKPDELFLKQLASGPGMVIEREFAERAGGKLGTAQGGLMCSGPYTFAGWKPGSEIRLERNPRYWDGQRRPKIQGVTVKFLTESSTLTSALLSGSVKGAYGVPATSIPALEKASGGKLYFGPSTQQVAIYAARNGGLMADTSVRKALSLAIDRQAIADKVYHGAAIPNQAVVSNTREAEAKDVYEEGWKTLPSVSVDLAQAKQLIAGVPDRSQKIVIALPAGDQTMLDVGTLVQDAAKRIGLTVELRALQPLDMSNLYYKPEYAKGFDGVIALTYSDHPDPLNFLPYVVPPDAFFNALKWDNPKAVRLMNQARSTLDPGPRAELLVQVLRLHAEDRVTIPVVGVANISFISNDIGGAPTSFAYLWMPDFALMAGR
ncbi:ABC transporter substrate-binding protein [Nonomuraea typhae]|uniref:ABC transporter substrate-binding protein n=1 Tax=Nonomuraea typhae TaxID=2603600 RepID=A0ABW7ZCJ1_9ACTN